MLEKLGPRIGGRRTQLFCCWLAWSRFRVVIPTWDQTLGTLVACLDAALRAGLDLPFACKGGMCSTCRAKLVEGEAAMDVNYSLEPWELKAGFILTCQARPISKNVVVDYDHV